MQLNITEKYKDSFEEALNNTIPFQKNTITTMLGYSQGRISPSGNFYKKKNFSAKRIRPLLFLFFLDAIGGNWKQYLPVAVSIELLHSFSLIHDDVQDEDIERHHRPTIWKIWGVPSAIITGNVLRTLSYLNLIDSVSIKGNFLKYSLVHKSFLSVCLKLINGQISDLDYEKQSFISVQDYLNMIRNKTGALIEFSVEFPAILQKIDKDQFKHFKNIGKQLGRVFQIKDDLLGIWGENNATGKPVGRDILRKKKSYPIVLAFQMANLGNRNLLEEIYAKEKLTTQDVKSVFSILQEMDIFNRTNLEIEKLLEKSSHSLLKLNFLNRHKKDLGELLEFLKKRIY
tara:strand:+ start:382 stop:1410 length:1029 start_codon:yes stop_codon:yes gene_type:complete